MSARLRGVSACTRTRFVTGLAMEYFRRPGIPGSRFHRFDARDVERLRQQRGSAVSSVQAEHRMVGPELVDGTQLSQWAGTRDAQGTFPELVRRLLASTPGITNASVRSGEGISASGWDGRADSAGTAYLPQGPLYFEFGVDRQSKTKADADYGKRRANPEGVVPAESCFVFMTPRRWSGGLQPGRRGVAPRHSSRMSGFSMLTTSKGGSKYAGRPLLDLRASGPSAT